MSAGRLAGLVCADPVLSLVIERFDRIGLPDAWLVAGAVAQGAWNALTGRAPGYGLKDVDIVYFDAADLSPAAEAAHETRLRQLFHDLPVKLDVKNEARVHLWYRDVFGDSIEAYRSTADAIATFPTTATSVGVRPEAGDLRVCAPFGLQDLLHGIVRPNKRQITRAIYERKVDRWRGLWPELTYLPWDAGGDPHTQPPSTT